MDSASLDSMVDMDMEALLAGVVLDVVRLHVRGTVGGMPVGVEEAVVMVAVAVAVAVVMVADAEGVAAAVVGVAAGVAGV
jgi:hypothetical protein